MYIDRHSLAHELMSNNRNLGWESALAQADRQLHEAKRKMEAAGASLGLGPAQGTVIIGGDAYQNYIHGGVPVQVENLQTPLKQSTVLLTNNLY